MRQWHRFALLLIGVAACNFSSPSTLDATPEVVLPTIEFEFEASGADETSATVMIPVVLSKPSDTPVTVMYSVLSGGSATPGDDFTTTASSLTFAAGELRQQIPIMITPDVDETEAIEAFDLALTTPDGAELGVIVIHKVTISDHILPRVQFMSQSTSTGEGAQTMLSLTLDKPAEGNSTVVIGVVEGTATAADLALAEGTVVTILSGATTGSVQIGEIDDALDEDDSESLQFELRGASPNLVVGTLASSTHTITDNDLPPVVQFAAATSTVNEDAGTVNLTVSLDAPSGRTVSVAFAGAGVSASAADATVTGSPGSLVFAPGETAKTIAVTIANDTEDENDETVSVTLSAPTNASLGTTTHTLTIAADATDLPPSVAFLAATTTVDEDTDGGPTVNLSVRLSVASGKTVTVSYSLNGASTATSGSDFNLTIATLSFPAGTTNRTITVDVNQNAPNNENNETVIVDLNTPTNATLGTPATHTLTITE